MGRGPISISVERFATSSPPRITISDDSFLFYSHYSTHTEGTPCPRTIFPLEIRKTACRINAMMTSTPATQTPSGSDSAASLWAVKLVEPDTMVWFAGRRYTAISVDITTKTHCISKEQKNGNQEWNKRIVYVPCLLHIRYITNKTALKTINHIHTDAPITPTPVSRNSIIHIQSFHSVE